MINDNPHIIGNENILVDISMLYQISGNDESFINTMVQTFLKTMPETIRKIEQSLSEKDWENVYRSAHFAKSSLSIIKIDEMIDWIMQAEVSAKNETDLNILPDLVKKIKEKYAFAEAVLWERFKVIN